MASMKPTYYGAMVFLPGVKCDFRWNFVSASDWKWIVSVNWNSCRVKCLWTINRFQNTHKLGGKGLVGRRAGFLVSYCFGLNLCLKFSCNADSNAIKWLFSHPVADYTAPKLILIRLFDTICYCHLHHHCHCHRHRCIRILPYIAFNPIYIQIYLLLSHHSIVFANGFSSHAIEIKPFPLILSLSAFKFYFDFSCYLRICLRSSFIFHHSVHRFL